MGDGDGDAYLYSEIEQILAFANGQRTIDIIVPKTDAVFAPIFQFHSTTGKLRQRRQDFMCISPPHVRLPFNGEPEAHNTFCVLNVTT